MHQEGLLQPNRYFTLHFDFSSMQRDLDIRAALERFRKMVWSSPKILASRYPQLGIDLKNLDPNMHDVTLAEIGECVRSFLASNQNDEMNIRGVRVTPSIL